MADLGTASGRPADDVGAKPATKAKEHPGFFSAENLLSLGVLLLIIFALRWSVASPYHVPTPSMEPTIKVGDRIFASKLAYGLKFPFTDIDVANWGKPKRGDIIVFRYPRDPEFDYVKRVVAVGGDEIQIIDDILYLNGEPQPRVSAEQERKILDDIEDDKSIKQLFKENLSGVEHWVMQNNANARKFTRSTWPPAGTGPYKVPEDAVFCVGDNRDSSTDSRVWNHVPLSYVRGKALFVIWSVFTPRDAAWPIFRWSRFGQSLY